METFDFCPNVDASAITTSRVLTAKFGDGYEQAAADGINEISSVWSITVSGTRTEMMDVMSFLNDHGQWKRFLWTNPLGVEGVYRADSFNTTKHGGPGVVITVQFRQVGAV